MVNEKLYRKKAAVIGGDARQLVIAEKLCEIGAEVYLCGFDQLNMTEPGYRKAKIDEIPFNSLDAIIFPVSGISSSGEIRSSFSAENLSIDYEQLDQLHENCLIFSGIRTPWTERSNKKFIYLFEEDAIAISNSIPTAEGILWLIIQHTDYTIHGSDIVITGGGRVGITLARVLHSLCANVTALSSVKTEIARLNEIGVDGKHLKDLNRFIAQADIWVNTIPSDTIITENAMSACKPGIFLIELASDPSIEQRRIASKMNLQYLEAPSLPGMVAPKTAGEILAEAILDLVIEKGG
ncbi:dipicolinate synthase subunit DpsA [Jeotgalibacillus terrae]|uniref:Dipicolinate synthase subunit DpsA n=1 Tax=Jeotgalibacillus terrae TaxID=587735 RepID=A0ABW5ZLB4_9BACL|nr:dipicolinate synthase subunit DpsA [Jeotgalibacillus terrae]MBM7579908.1 dipicolinate synthase subunit A [Jeotgalibacillus terrae]